MKHDFFLQFDYTGRRGDPAFEHYNRTLNENDTIKDVKRELNESF